MLIVPESTPEVTHFGHIFGKKSMLVTRGKLFEEKVGLNEEDVLLDQCCNETADLSSRVGVLLLLAKDLVPEGVVVFGEADHLLGSFVEASYVGNLLPVLLREKVPGIS